VAAITFAATCVLIAIGNRFHHNNVVQAATWTYTLVSPDGKSIVLRASTLVVNALVQFFTAFESDMKNMH